MASFRRFGALWWAAPMSARAATLATVASLVVFALLVFIRLGEYALWDDEAQTALFGQAVWQTGDTSAVHGHNVVLYRDAVELDHRLLNRLVAPLPYYVEALFVRGSRSAWWARLPFALAGLGTIALLLRWLAHLQATRVTWVVSILAGLGNVSLILYSRQARYYALAMLLSTALTCAYAHRDRGRWAIAAMCGFGAALCATHYLCYAGVVAALAVDYLCFGRATAKLSWRTCAVIIASQLLLCAPVVLIWFPLGKDLARQQAGFEAVDRFVLWLRTLRDMNNCEYGAALVVLAAPLLYRRANDPLLLRLPLALVVSTLLVTAFSPQPARSSIADVRYVSFLIPAILVLGVRVITALRLPGALGIVAGVVVFQSTILHAVIGRLYPSDNYGPPVRTTLTRYVGELVDPPVSAYRLTADWLEAHAAAGETVRVLPDFAMYPLMFHVPKLVYAWQLTEKRAGELPPLPPIHVQDKVPPDWLVAFNYKDLDSSTFAALHAQGADYVPAVALPATGTDSSRAELFWHRFAAEGAYDRSAPITIWRRR